MVRYAGAEYSKEEYDAKLDFDLDFENERPHPHIVSNTKPVMHSEQSRETESEYMKKAQAWAEQSWKENFANFNELDDKHIALRTVMSSGRSLEQFSDRLRNDPEVVALAYAENADSLQYAGEDIQKAIKDSGQAPKDYLTTAVHNQKAFEAIKQSMAEKRKTELDRTHPEIHLEQAKRQAQSL